MSDQFVLEIKWNNRIYLFPSGEQVARLVGPFGSQAEAQKWARLNILNGSWNVTPLAYPSPPEGTDDE